MILPVIMAGGTGSRLWPMSRELYPKQFLRLHGDNSMLQETVTRLKGLDVSAPLVICNEEHRFLVAEQLRQIDQLSDNIILEPVGRNTAPAITLAALSAIDNGSDPLLLVLAADHVIESPDAFHQAVQNAIPFAEQGKLVTFGIVPTGPETGYGYIQRGTEFSSDANPVFGCSVLSRNRILRPHCNIWKAASITGTAVCFCSAPDVFLKRWRNSGRTYSKPVRKRLKLRILMSSKILFV